MDIFNPEIRIKDLIAPIYIRPDIYIEIVNAEASYIKEINRLRRELKDLKVVLEKRRMVR